MEVGPGVGVGVDVGPGVRVGGVVDRHVHSLNAPPVFWHENPGEQGIAPHSVG